MRFPYGSNKKRPCANAQTTATPLDIPTGWDPNTKKEPTGLIAYPAAQGRAVPGCGSQHLLRALIGTRILLAAAPTSPSCSCRRQRSAPLRFPYGSNKKTRANALAAATPVDIPTGWDPRANQSPTGALVTVLAHRRPVRFPYGSNKKSPERMLEGFL